LKFEFWYIYSKERISSKITVFIEKEQNEIEYDNIGFNNLKYIYITLDWYNMFIYQLLVLTERTQIIEKKPSSYFFFLKFPVNLIITYFINYGWFNHKTSQYLLQRNNNIFL